MNTGRPRTGGGTFCRFTVGVPRPGASVRHLRYIARPEAARETLLWNLPASVTGLRPEDAEGQEQTPGDYAALTAGLYAYAQAQERREIARHHSRGRPRTHYRALLSFEADPGVGRAQATVLAWLEAVFPRAPAAAFFHRNTAHLHAHVWVAARQTDGRKVNLDARAFRQLDEAWNHEYAAALGRPEHEHLHKKWQTEGYKLLRRSGESAERPMRVAHGWDPSLFTERERRRLGAYDPALEKLGPEGGKLETGEVGNRNPTEPRQNEDFRSEGHERIENGAAGNQPTAPRGPGDSARPQPATPTGADAVRGALEAAARALSSSQNTVSEARRLHAAADSVHAAAARLARQSADLAADTEREIDNDLDRER